MLKIIVYEDNNTFMAKNIDSINKVLANSDIDYRILKFEKFSPKLEKIIQTKGTKKIYILDVEVSGVSGLEVGSQIRENDFDSIIIFATAHDKYYTDVFYSRLMVLDFICKYKGYEGRLMEDITAALKILYQQKTFVFRYNHVVYRIPYNHICYIEKEPLIKRCIIHTINNKFYIVKSINCLVETFGQNFMKTHQSCIVNMDNVKNVDFSTNVITFKNGEFTNLFSNTKKREVKERVSNSK